MLREIYITDLSDVEWNILEPLLPPPNKLGRPRKHPWREILNAIFYIIRSGCAWKLLPHDLPPWKTFYHYYRLWRMDGTWEHIHTVVRNRVRTQLGRDPQPSAGVMDRDGVELLLGQNIKGQLPRLKHVWLDSGYKGEGKGKQ